ncbi:efflux RND transporter permease subunit, partial [Jatrophihabitans endophyticus]|uniref:efflux RND transporter permease subunit n=1 Tax=Jatrophihabitans endophyticus TaxID=1206085 RepID=UPI0019E3A204
MRLTDLFIQRIVLSCVVSILVLVFGLRAEQSMPVERFPHTVIGRIEIQTQYYGADAQTIAGFVTTPLEGAVSSAQGIDFISSTSSTSLSDISVRLRLGYDPARALAEIQTYVTAATAKFPPGVQQPSIQLRPSGSSVMSLSVTSEQLSPGQVADYVSRIITPRLQAVPGVQSVDVNGSPDVVMRVWIDPQKLAAFGLTPGEVYAALANNNFITGIGQTKGEALSVTLDITSGLHDAEQFRRLVVRQQGGRIIRLGDVADVRFGTDPDDFKATLDGQQGVFIDVNPTPTANTLAVADALEQQVRALQRQMPPAFRMDVVDDTADFIHASIREVVITLFESLGIVGLVVFAFLGSPRAVLVPLVTIPLSLVGTFAMMAIMGFSINLLTLLALVLA